MIHKGGKLSPARPAKATKYATTHQHCPYHRVPTSTPSCSPKIRSTVGIDATRAPHPKDDGPTLEAMRQAPRFGP